MSDAVIKAGQIWRGERYRRTLYIRIVDRHYGENVIVHPCEAGGAPVTVTSRGRTFIRHRVIRRHKFEPGQPSNFVLYRE
jgi:hypothetical protein